MGISLLDVGTEEKWRKGRCALCKLEVLIPSCVESRYWPNTFNAHRLLLYAEQQQFQHMLELIEALFIALYEHGENISTIPTLIHLAQDVGLSGCNEMLHSNAFTTEVVEEDDFAKYDLEIE